MEKKMNPINSFKRWLLEILVPYIEGTKKSKRFKEKGVKKNEI